MPLNPILMSIIVKHVCLYFLDEVLTFPQNFSAGVASNRYLRHRLAQLRLVVQAFLQRQQLLVQAALGPAKFKEDIKLFLTFISF
jgi:hypothetical protein